MRRSPCLAALVSLLLLVLAVPPARAADPTAAPPPPCTSPECRQFDFWLGKWNVTDPAGQPAGTNEITSILGGCVLQEHWVGAKGGSGTSFNIYDAPFHRWHQTWVDASGGLVELDGTFTGGKMVLEGERPARRGPPKTVHHRITWTPIAGDSVRQLWDTTTDGGKTWTVAFDGLYVRAR